MKGANRSMDGTEFELERCMERKSAARACQNLMGRFCHYRAAQRISDIMDMWADDSDSRIELPWGVYDGKNGVDRYFGETPARDDAERRKGYLRIHALSTPVFEVAEDGQTARGAWFSQGIFTQVTDGNDDCRWRWVKLGVDFILEDDKWKIWHMAVFPLIDTPYEKAWYDQPKLTMESFGTDHTPDRKPTARKLWNMNREYEYPLGHPATPRPYANFDLEVGYGY